MRFHNFFIFIILIHSLVIEQKVSFPSVGMFSIINFLDYFILSLLI